MHNNALKEWNEIIFVVVAVVVFFSLSHSLSLSFSRLPPSTLVIPLQKLRKVPQIDFRWSESPRASESIRLATRRRRSTSKVPEELSKFHTYSKRNCLNLVSGNFKKLFDNYLFLKSRISAIIFHLITAHRNRRNRKNKTQDSLWSQSEEAQNETKENKRERSLEEEEDEEGQRSCQGRIN
jgi:hypothetical protein